MRPEIPYRLNIEIGYLHEGGVRIGRQKIELSEAQSASMAHALGRAILDASPCSPLRTRGTGAKGRGTGSPRDRFVPPSEPLLLSGFQFQEGKATGYFLAVSNALIWSSNQP